MRALSGEEKTSRKRVFKFLILVVAVLCTLGSGWSDSQPDQWPCGELPKLLRNQKGEPIWLGSTKLKSRALNRPNPSLPSSVRVEGNIIADVLIGPDGRVRCVRVRKGHPILRRAVEEAAKQWTFKPILINSQPIAAFGFLKFQFSN